MALLIGACHLRAAAIHSQHGTQDKFPAVFLRLQPGLLILVQSFFDFRAAGGSWKMS
jgi:hypothetical protein